MAATKRKAARDERSARTGEFVKKGTEKKDPTHTVTETRKTKKRK